MIKSEQEYFADEKLCVCVYMYVGNKSRQFVMKQLPAGAIHQYKVVCRDAIIALTHNILWHKIRCHRMGITGVY